MFRLYGLRFAVGVVLLLALGAAACGEPLATPEPVYLSAAGSMSMESLLVELAEVFHKHSPLISLDVMSGGTSYGLEALRAGKVDIALASWTPSNLEADYRSQVIGRDAIAIIVHPDNPLDGLGLLQLKALFSGRVHEWRAVGQLGAKGDVQPISREEGSGLRQAFEILAMEDEQVAPTALVAPSPEAVIKYVASHPDAIGYVPSGLLTEEVKAIRIEGELPSIEAVMQGEYPLIHELLLVVDEPVSEAVESFLAFALSPAGQEIVGQRYARVR